MKRTLLPLIALVVAATAFAQGMQSAPAPGTVETMKQSFNFAKDYIIKSAEQMPEADYAFKPTPEVRSFGQIVAHIADANYYFCSMILGEKNPGPGVEKNKTSKADIVAGLKGAYEYCGRAYAIPDSETGAKFKAFGQEFTRAGGLMLNTTHNWEHYGNMVTYMRLKGQVPPSSKQM